MPRVTLCKDKQRERDNDAMIKELMLTYRNRLGYNSWKDVYQLCGFGTLNTFNQRRNHPSDFTIGEARRVIRALKIPPEEIKQYF